MKCVVDKTIINYEVIGEGKTILFFSGFGNDLTTMKKGLEPIFENENKWRRIYVDHLGVGDTVIGDNIKDVKDVLETMRDFVDQVMGDESYILGGYSFGGYLSRYILSSRFDKVDGLFLLTPLIIKELETGDVDRSIQVVKYVDSEIQRTIDERIGSDLFGAMQKTDREFQKRMMESHSTFKIELDHFDGSFEKPTLIITGRQDDTVGYRDAYNILDKYPRATYICMDKCGHAAQIEQENIVQHLVKEWLYRLEEDEKRASQV